MARFFSAEGLPNLPGILLFCYLIGISHVSPKPFLELPMILLPML